MHVFSERTQFFSFLLRGQSSHVRWVCCWREVISIMRQTHGKVIAQKEVMVC
jgi:hypothetical protein